MAGDGTPIMERIVERSKTIKGAAFTRGDYCVAVRWMEREDADSELLTFTYDEESMPDVLNSTEIRVIGFAMDKQKDLIPCLIPVRSTRSKQPWQPKSKHHGTCHLAPKLEKTIIGACHAH